MLFYMGGDCVPQLNRARVVGVMDVSFGQRVCAGTGSHRWYVEIGFADPQADNIFHGRGNVEKAPNA
jgi:hypothetical protein